MFELDHLVIAAETLDAGREWAEETLGVKFQPGGQHGHFGTHNILLGLQEGIYLEVIAIDPAAPAPGYPRWYGLDCFEGPPRLNNWSCRATSLKSAVNRYPKAGEPLALARGDLRWKMAVPDSGMLPFDGLFPALIEWTEGVHPSRRLAPSGCQLKKLIIRHPSAGLLASELSGDLIDPLVVFEEGSAALEAEIARPDGVRVLK